MSSTTTWISATVAKPPENLWVLWRVFPGAIPMVGRLMGDYIFSSPGRYQCGCLSSSCWMLIPENEQP